MADNKRFIRCMYVPWTYTNLHSHRAETVRFSRNVCIYLKIKVVYARKQAIYKVYSGRIHFVFQQNTILSQQLLLTEMNVIGTPHRGTDDTAHPKIDVC